MPANGGIHVTWPMVGIATAMVISIVTGAIQLGGVQTHVEINTDRMNLLEAREREHLVEIATIKARQMMNERRLDTIEAARPSNETIDARIKALEAINKGR